MSSAVKSQDNMDDLRSLLHEAVTDPTAMIKEGKAPPPYFLALDQPPDDKSAEQGQKLEALLGASALARIFASMTIIKARQSDNGRNVPYSLAKPAEYVSAFNEKTEATVDAFTTGPLASMYRSMDQGAAVVEDLTITRPDLHALVLRRLFDGLGAAVGKEQLAELDAVLTSFTAALKSYRVAVPEGRQQDLPELKHAVVVNHVRATDITGTGAFFVYEPFTRIVIISVKPQDWALALQKTNPKDHDNKQEEQQEQSNSSHATTQQQQQQPSGDAAGRVGLAGWPWKPKPKPDERIKFTLATTTMELLLDEAKYNASKSRFESIFKSMAEGNEELSEIAESGGLALLGRKTSTIYSTAAS